MNPVWHIHNGNPPAAEVVAQPDNARGAAISFVMLLNLAAVANTEDREVLWAFLRRYAPALSPQMHPRLDKLVGYAIAFFRDFVRPTKTYRAPDEIESAALRTLSEALGRLPADATAETIQSALYDVARPIPRFQDMTAKGATPERPGVSNLWFNTLYQILLGEERGPRFGSFAALYGVPETRALVARALSGELIAGHEAFRAARAKPAA